mgnify:CR=1 FL=1
MLTKNPNYVGGWDSSKIVTDTITLLLLEDSSASFAAYNSGEAVMIKDVPTDEIPSLTKAEDGGDFYVDTILGTYYVSLNLKRDAFKDAKVRKALSLAIDRDYVANTIMQGTYSTADSIVGPGIVDENGYFHDNGNAPYISADYEANLAEAKKLLAEAGYPNGEATHHRVQLQRCRLPCASGRVPAAGLGRSGHHPDHQQDGVVFLHRRSSCRRVRCCP